MTLASEQSRPTGLALDDTHAYWTNQAAPGDVMRVARGGGTPEVVAAGHTNPTGIAVDSEAVYWTDYAAEYKGGVWKIRKDDAGKPGAAVEIAPGENSALTIAVDDVFVYWTTPSMVFRIPKSGGKKSEVAHDQATPGGIAVDLTGVYWACVVGGTVMRWNLDADALPEVLATGQAGPAGLAIDNANVYWTNMYGDADAGAQAVMAAPKYNGTPRVIALGQSNPTGIAELGTSLCWANNDLGTIACKAKTATESDETEILATGEQGPFGVVMSLSAVYWTSQEGGTIRYVAR